MEVGPSVQSLSSDWRHICEDNHHFWLQNWFPTFLLYFRFWKKFKLDNQKILLNNFSVKSYIFLVMNAFVVNYNFKYAKDFCLASTTVWNFALTYKFWKNYQISGIKFLSTNYLTRLFYRCTYFSLYPENS